MIFQTMDKIFTFSAAVEGDRVAVCCSCNNYIRHGMIFDKNTATWRATLTLKTVAGRRYWYYVKFLWNCLFLFNSNCSTKSMMLLRLTQTSVFVNTRSRTELLRYSQAATLLPEAYPTMLYHRHSLDSTTHGDNC